MVGAEVATTMTTLAIDARRTYGSLRLKRCTPLSLDLRPNVRAKPTVEADAGWPRKDDTNTGLERPDGGCRSGSAP